jgi:hypothetical protein
VILSNLNLNELKSGLATTTVEVPQFGGSVKLTQLSVKGYVKLGNLQQSITKRKLEPEHATALMMCASLICAMVDPVTGAYLVNSNQLDEFEAQISSETLEILILENHKVNPIKGFETLDTKKK